MIVGHYDQIMPKAKILIFWIFIIGTIPIFGQPTLQIANIGDFETEEGEIITNCKIGFRTLGKLNSEKSNTVLWPTWFGGTTEDIINIHDWSNLFDTTRHYVILVDAMSNGVSSSPSNTNEFPENISIRDMVKTQHRLLKRELDFRGLPFPKSFHPSAGRQR